MTETLVRHDRGNVLSMDRWFPHPAEKVWRALTQPEDLRHWFPSLVEAELQVGGTIHFVFAGGEGPAMDGTVLEFDPPHVVSFTWGDSTLRFELRPEARPDGPGCRMLFSHTFGDRVSAASYAAGWHICFQNLYLFIDDKPADVGLDQWAALHDGFVERFGLDGGSVEAGPDGGRVIRFERQLTKPVDDVWAVLTDGEHPTVGGPVPAAFTNGLAPGVVTAIDAPTMLEYRAGGQRRVRWELAAGNGGAVLLLSDEARERAAGADRADDSAAWADHLTHLAKRLREPARHT